MSGDALELELRAFRVWKTWCTFKAFQAPSIGSIIICVGRTNMYMCVIGERKLYTYTLNSRFWIEIWRKEDAIHARRRRCYLQKNSKWHHSARLPDSTIIRESRQNTTVSSNTTKMLASHQNLKKSSKPVQERASNKTPSQMQNKNVRVCHFK